MRNAETGRELVNYGAQVYVEQQDWGIFRGWKAKHDGADGHQFLGPDDQCECGVLGAGLRVEVDPEPVSVFDYPTAWALQEEIGRSLEHDPECSSVPGSHGGMGGPMWLCDCGALVKAWEERQ